MTLSIQSLILMHVLSCAHWSHEILQLCCNLNLNNQQQLVTITSIKGNKRVYNVTISSFSSYWNTYWIGFVIMVHCGYIKVHKQYHILQNLVQWDNSLAVQLIIWSNHTLHDPDYLGNSLALSESEQVLNAEKTTKNCKCQIALLISKICWFNSTWRV